jgi:hypothetical protein
MQDSPLKRKVKRLRAKLFYSLSKNLRPSNTFSVVVFWRTRFGS